MGMPYKDLTGQTTIGGVYVKHVIPNGRAGMHKKWMCVCPICKKEFVAQSNHLTDGVTKSCKSCGKHIKYNDLSGQRFGLLTVVKRLFDYKNVTYLCKCDCGNYHIATMGHLKSGTVKSCGCLKSSYEHTIKQILDKNKIKYEVEKTFVECRVERCLPFDFFIPDLNMLVEMQGEQHFEAVDFWGGEEGFKKRQEYDKIKEGFCLKNGYRFLTIRYDEDVEKRVNEDIVWPLRKHGD